MHSISYETKLKLKDLFVCLAQEEVKIERFRQVLASIPDFEPYAAFKRIDRTSSGFLTNKSIGRYLKENGYREMCADDVVYMIRYFDQDDDMKLTFHDFLQVLLPCDNAQLRADVSQRPTFRIGKDDLLPASVEQALTTLLLKEVKLQIKIENIKRFLEGSYDFNIQAAFKVIDDWSYGYLDDRNLRRFLRNTGVLLTQQELFALIRRIDLDGDAKISYEEFYEGVKSQFHKSQKIGQGMRAKGILSSQNGNTSTMVKSASRNELIDMVNNKKPYLKKGTSKSVQRRPKSACKTSKKFKRKQRSISRPECSCEYHHHCQLPQYDPLRKSPERNLIDDNSPARSNKSVTFNQQVKVREYESLHAQRQKLLQEQEQALFKSTQQNPFGPCHLHSNFDQYQIHSQNLSPLREKSSSNNFYESQRSQFASPILERSSLRGSPVRENRSSPLKLFNENRPLNYSYNPNFARRQPEFSEIEDSSRFDRIEMEECHKALKEFIFIERELESLKIELTLKPDFNLLDAFRMVDFPNQGWVNFQDLAEAISRLFDIDTLSVVGMENLQLFFSRYDTNKDGKLSLAEFCKALTPVSKEYAALVQGRAEFYSKKGFHPRDYFNTETKRNLKILWGLLLQTERLSENVRIRLSTRPTFNLRFAFKYCDKDANGVITSVDFRDMLASHGFFATDKELNLLMNKFDKYSDAKITMTDFIEQMVPKVICVK